MRLRDRVRSLAVHLTDVAGDIIVLQQGTLLYFVGFATVLVGPTAWASRLLELTLALQLFSNILLSRERAVQLSSTGHLAELAIHVRRRVALICCVCVPAAALIPSHRDAIVVAAPLSCLVLSNIAWHSAIQVRSGLRWLSAYTVPSSLFIAIVMPLGVACGVWAAVPYAILLAISLTLQTRVTKIDPSRAVPASGRINRAALWAGSVATAEYDRYLIGFGGAADVGANYGALSSISMIPLMFLTSIGPRLVGRSSSSRAKKLSFLAVVIFQLLLLTVSSFILAPELVALLTANVFKILCHTWTAREYFALMHRSANRAAALSTSVAVIALISTVALLFDYLAIAVGAKVLAGLSVLVLFAYFVPDKRSEEPRSTRP